MVMPRAHDEDDEEKETEKSGTSLLERKADELLLNSRRIFLSSSVNDQSAKAIIRQLWVLEGLAPEKPILLVINSPGGSVHSGFAIFDQIQMIASPVYTLVTGLAASMGSILSLVAEPTKRFATRHSQFMLHQPLIGGTIQGQATDLEIQAKEIRKTRELLVQIYVKATGQDQKKIEKTLDRDTWMSADEAKEFGLIHKIVRSYKEIDLS